MGSNSLTPRPFNVMDAKRAREEEARRREQVTSARNTERTTVGSGGRLDIDGGDLTVQNGGNAVVKDGGVWRIEDGGGAELTGDGQIRVVGHGDYLGKPYEVSMTVESFETSSAVWGKVLSPGLNFKSALTATDGYTRLYSNGGNGLRAETYDPALGRSLLEIHPAEGSITWVNSDGYRTIDVASYGMRVVHYSHLTSVQTGMQETDEDLTMGHSSKFTTIRALLRTKTDGRLSLESMGTAEAALTMPGDGTVDITGILTVNGAPVGGTVTSVAGRTGAVVLGKADVGLSNVDNTSDANKPVSTATANALAGKAPTVHAHAIADVTGLRDALDGKLPNLPSRRAAHFESATFTATAATSITAAAFTARVDVPSTNDFSAPGPAAGTIRLQPGVYAFGLVGKYMSGGAPGQSSAIVSSLDTNTTYGAGDNGRAVFWDIPCPIPNLTVLAADTDVLIRVNTSGTCQMRAVIDITKIQA